MSTLMSYVRSNAVAFLALFVALGGTSYAAVNLPKNSVTAKQIAPKAVGTSEVKDGSLLKGDFKAGQLPTGPTGPRGPAGRSALQPLQPGETVTGWIGGDFHASQASSDWRVLASFPIPGSAAPLTTYFDGYSPGETCQGTQAFPTAPVGVLCIYPDFAQNPDLSASSHGTIATRLGFQVTWVTTQTGDTYFRASYAYTQGPLAT